MRMNLSTTSNLISGAVALVIFVVIALATGASAAVAIIGGVVLGLFTFVVAFAISRAIASRHS